MNMSTIHSFSVRSSKGGVCKNRRTSNPTICGGGTSTAASAAATFTTMDGTIVDDSTTTTTITNLNGVRPELSTTCMAHTTAKDAGIYIGLVSEEKGLGAFSTTEIPFGTYLGDYYGERLSRKQVESRYYKSRVLDEEDYNWIADRNSRSQEITGSYLLELSNGKFVDAEDGDKSNWTRFMNHAEDTTNRCNVKLFDRLTTNGDVLDYPQCYAIRDIAPYEELSWDYGAYFFLERN